MVGTKALRGGVSVRVPGGGVRSKEGGEELWRVHERRRVHLDLVLLASEDHHNQARKQLAPQTSAHACAVWCNEMNVS